MDWNATELGSVSALPQTSLRTTGKSLLAGDNNHSVAFTAAPKAEVPAAKRESNT